MTDTTGAPLSQNEHVRELFEIMRENGTDTSALTAMLSYVAAMEKNLATAVTELTHVRSELADIREIQDHPIKAKLQKAADALEVKIEQAREGLKAVKDAIIDGCKNAVAAFKEKGKAVLQNIMSFFRVGDKLNEIRDSLADGIRGSTQAIANIEAFSVEYHKTGQHLKNMRLTIIGRPADAAAKENGKIALVAQAPFKAVRSCLTSARKLTDGVIKKVAAFEQSAVKKPSVLDEVDRLTREIAAVAKTAPTRERSKAQEVSV